MGLGNWFKRMKLKWSLAKQNKSIQKYIKTYAQSTLKYDQKFAQTFPYNGRKQMEPVEILVKHFHTGKGLICDPFSGSGIFPLAFSKAGKPFIASEWDLVWNRLSNAPWRIPKDQEELDTAYNKLIGALEPRLQPLYETTCTCGGTHHFKYLDFDLDPLTYQNPTSHERLGDGGENVIYRGSDKCECGAVEKHFDASDLATLTRVNALPLSPFVQQFSNSILLENSRINITGVRRYHEQFPHRSLVALGIIKDEIDSLEGEFTEETIQFLEDALLVCVASGRYKDYRSQTQNLYHIPPNRLREVNLFYSYKERFTKRRKSLFDETNPNKSDVQSVPISLCDYRELFAKQKMGSVEIICTDPTWVDGEPYFERSQLYAPWIDPAYSLREQTDRLNGEIVVSNSPRREDKNETKQWYDDIQEFFENAREPLMDYGLVTLYCATTSSSGRFITALNSLSAAAKAAGFEPMRRMPVKFDVDDPGMRQVAGATNILKKDTQFFFAKLPDEHRRWYLNVEGEPPLDLDEVGFGIAQDLFKEYQKPFAYSTWRDEFNSHVIAEYSPSREEFAVQPSKLKALFNRICHRAWFSRGYVTRSDLSYSQSFNQVDPFIRVRNYLEKFLKTKGSKPFSYEELILEISEYVDEGDRQLLAEQEYLGAHLKKLIGWRCKLADGQYIARKPTKFRPMAGHNHPNQLPPEKEGVYDYVDFCADLLRKMGFTDVIRTVDIGDEGRDIEATNPEGRPGVVEVKHWKNGVGSQPIQRVSTYARAEGKEWAMAIASSHFTKGLTGGKRWAMKLGVATYSGLEIDDLMRMYWPNYPN